MVDQPPNVLVLALLGLYVAVMFILGFFANRKVQTVEDYLVAGRKLPFLLAVPSLVATWYGVGMCLGVSGAVYSSGVRSVLPDPFGASLAFVLAGLFYAARFRRLKLLTVADILGKCYGKGIELCAAVLMMPFYIGTLAAQMVALGYLLHLFAHIDPTTSIVVGSVFMVIYTMAGGMWAVSLTDFIQMIVLLGGLLILLPVVWEHFSHDPASSVALIKAEFTSLLPQGGSASGWLVYLGQIFITGVGAVMGQDIIQRCLACRSGHVARWSALSAGLIYFCLGLIPIVIGLAGRSLVPLLTAPELLIPQLATEHLSPLFIVIFVGGLIVAIMSTADSYLLAGTSILTLNVLLPILPERSEASRLWILRSSSVLMAVVAFALATAGFNIYQLIIHSGAMLFVAIFVPVTMALYWKRASSIAAWSSLIGGVIGWGAFVTWGLAMGELGGDETLFAAAAVGGMVSLTTYLIVTWSFTGLPVRVDESTPATDYALIPRG